MKSFLFFLLISLSCCGISAQIQDSLPPNFSERKELIPLTFEEEKIRKFKEDPVFDYSEAVAEDNWWTTFKKYIRLKWQNFLNWLFGDFEAPFLLALFLDILPYLLLGLLLAFVLYLFARLNPAAYAFGSDGKAEVIFDEEERVVKTRDIQKLIKKALAKRNFRLAVRYHFLYILQQLSRNNLVVYDNTKTDEEYLQEIQKWHLRQQFQKLNRIYDFIWYGNFEATAENYDQIKNEFHKMESLIAAENG